MLSLSSAWTQVSRASAVLAVRTLAAVLRVLPHRMTLASGRHLGRIMHATMGSRRLVADENIKRAFPNLSPQSRRQLIADHFRHLGLVLAEVLVFPQWDRRFARRVRIVGREVVDQCLRDGVGCVVFVPHLGNWELLAPVWPTLAPDPMVLALPLPNPAFDRLLTKSRTVTGIEVVDRTGGLRRAVTGLHQGRAVGFLADQDGGDDGVFVPIFGVLASCQRSPVVLARRLGCPIILCVTSREPDGTHQVILERVPTVEDPNEADDVQALTWIYQRLECHIRERPEQWLWIHRRWKTRPPENAS